MSKSSQSSDPSRPGKADTRLAEIFHRAIDLHKAGQLDEAEALYLQLIQNKPDFTRGWQNMGALQRKRGHSEAAIAFARRALELGGIRQEAMGNLENALIDVGRAEEAYSIHLTVPPQGEGAERPDQALARDGRLRRAAGFAREACALFERITDPEVIKSIELDHAMAELEAGRYRQGFARYECRWRSGQIRAPKPGAPKWNLTDSLAGKHLAVFCEQGLGDWIFLTRFLPRLRALGLGKLTVVARTPLVRLTEASGLADVVLDRDGGTAPEAIDGWISAFDLCRLFLDEDQPIPGPVPLTVPEDSLERGRVLTAPHANRLKVGICWATSPTGRKAAHKSVDVFRFLPLTEVPGAQFFSLYKGKDDDAVLRNGLSGIIADTGRSERDMADSAGLIAHLDLVITVDTGVAHLAAAMGKPTWILTPEAAFWYWRSYGEACPFYPSVRLIRQVCPGDWDVPFARIKMDLERMLR